MSTQAPTHSQRQLQDIARNRLGLHERIDQDHAAAAAAHKSGDFKEYWTRLQRAYGNEQVDERLEKREQKIRKTVDASVTHEAPPYAPDSPHSWVLDVGAVREANMATVLGAQTDANKDAEERLAKHAIDVRKALNDSSSKWGKQIRNQINENFRTENESEHRRRVDKFTEELRTTGTGGGATASASGGQGAAFVSPFFLLQSWAPYRGVQRSFVDQCRTEPLPPYGLQAYVPFFSTGTTVSSQTEGSALSSSSPEAALEGAKIEAIDGQVVITQQISDRGFTGGGSFDRVVGQQLQEQLDQEIDLYVLKKAIENGESVAGASEYKTAKLYEDMGKAKEKLSDTAGTRLRATHFFTTSDFFNFVSRQVDPTTEEPIVKPWYAQGWPAETQADDYDGKPEPPFSRFMNIVMPGGVVWMSNDNIPTVGTTNHTQLVMSAPGVAIAVCEGQPFFQVFRETYANELRVVVILKSYVAAITRHKAGTATISGAGYVTTQV